MLSKLTSKNQISLPKKIVAGFPGVAYFDVSSRDGNIVLSPVTVTLAGERLRAIRAKIRGLGLSEEAVTDAVRWARSRRR